MNKRKNHARLFLMLLPVLLVAGMTGCTAEETQDAGQPASGVAEPPPPAERAEAGQAAEEPPEHKADEPSGEAAEEPASGGRDAGGEPSVFSLKIGDAVISIGDWDDKVDLEAILGPPSEEEVIRLENADTHTGSFLKKLKYDGLEIDLFSPSDNGKTFWILEMRVSKEGIPTAAGIGIGSTLDEALEAYPGMESVSNIRDDDQVYRLYSHSQYEYVEVVVRDGVVKALNVAGSL